MMRGYAGHVQSSACSERIQFVRGKGGTDRDDAVVNRKPVPSVHPFCGRQKPIRNQMAFEIRDENRAPRDLSEAAQQVNDFAVLKMMKK